jgi:hypothetical protein
MCVTVVQVAGEASLSVCMVPVNTVTAISLQARPSDDSSTLQAPSCLVVVVNVETEDGLPIPAEAATEGLSVKMAVPHGKSSKQAVLEAAEDLDLPQGSFAYRSDTLTSAGGQLSLSQGHFPSNLTAQGKGLDMRQQHECDNNMEI